MQRILIYTLDVWNYSSAVAESCCRSISLSCLIQLVVLRWEAQKLMCLKVTEMRFTIGRSAAAGLLAVIKLIHRCVTVSR
jgi:hypothetical protein